MSRFKILETKGFQEDLTQDFHGQRKRIETKLQEYVYPQLAHEPHFGKNIQKLRNYKPDTWRYRIGNFRFFYEVDDDKRLIIMIAADNRKDAY